MELRFQRAITNQELADLPTSWESSTVDTGKYAQSVISAKEVDEITYLDARSVGLLCQEFNGKFYIGA